MGHYGWRPVSDVRPHLDALRRLGWTWEQIGRAAGTSAWVPHQAGTGGSRRIRSDCAQAILSVPLTQVDSHRGVSSVGLRRRMQALAWMGWPAREVAARTGIPRATLQTLALRTRQPSVRLHRRVVAVYEQLAHLPGPSQVAAGKARASGFAPPLAWDDDTIDDPRARPNGVRPRTLHL